MGLFRSLFGRKKSRVEQIPLYTPQQTSAMNQAVSIALEGLRNPSQGFEPIAEDEIRRYYSETVPALADRFTAMGEGAQRSSAFANALSGSGADLASNLAAQKAKYTLMREGLLQSLLGMGLTQQNSPLYMPGSPGVLRSAVPGLLSSGLKFLGGLF